MIQQKTNTFKKVTKRLAIGVLISIVGFYVWKLYKNKNTNPLEQSTRQTNG
jgi:predicted negative regulator of RcsB-dependent stress response